MISKVFCRQFRYALLNKDEKLIAELEKNVLKNGATVSEIENEKYWAETAFPLVEEAILLREQGCSVRSSKFRALIERANKIGFPLPVYLRGIVHSADSIEYQATNKTFLPAIRQKALCRKEVEKKKEAEKKNEVLKKKTVKTTIKIYKPYPIKEPVVKHKHNIPYWLDKLKKIAIFEEKDEKQIEDLCNTIIQLFPDAVEKVNRIIDISKVIDNAFQAGQAGTPEHVIEYHYEKLRSIDDNCKDMENFLRSMFFRGKTIHDWESLRTTPFSDSHPNFLPNLQPSKKWTVLIDEAGDLFFKDANDSAFHSRGRLAAIVVPDYCELPNLSAKFHANKRSNESIKRIVDAITHSPCGVLGISVDALRRSNSNLWYTGIETLIDLIVHLLPIDGKTFLNIYVEQRDPFTPQKSSFIDEECMNCLNRLALSNPYRAKMIDMSASFINKSDHPWNGYADTIAHCWGGSVSEILKDSNWINSCLLDFTPELQRLFVNSILRTKPLSEQEWDELFNASAAVPETLSNFLLKVHGEEIRHDVRRWKKYLKHVQKQLLSGTINSSLLKKQLDWLRSYVPDETSFSPRTQLLWLTTQLIRDNNCGKTDCIVPYQKELEELCALVFPEDAPLTCQTSLQVAAAYMNDYNFRTAYDAVKGWLGVDESVPGVQCYSQILSTIGQLNAFVGHQSAAIEACNRAVEYFEKLSDHEEMVNNVNQTLSYKVIAMMDSESIPENMTQELERYLGRPLMEAAERFAVTNYDSEKYMHHVFLRYFVHINSPELKSIIDRYLSFASEWKTGTGHPWELIQFYRAVLLTDSDAQKARLEQAYKQVAQFNEGTFQVIACVILGSLYYFSSSCKEELADLTQRIVDTMPYLGKDRVAALKNQLEAPQEPLALAKKVLPFNYR